MRPSGKVSQVEGLSNAVQIEDRRVCRNDRKIQKRNSKARSLRLIKRVFEETGLADSLRAGGIEQAAAVENIEELINAAVIVRCEDRNAVAGRLSPADRAIQRCRCLRPGQRPGRLDDAACGKGLEFENVFIVGLEQNILPHERSSTSEDDLEEERRLFFVGITRAKSGLHISLAQHRLVHGMLMRTIPSQFLFEIGAKIARPQMRGYDEFRAGASAGGIFCG